MQEDLISVIVPIYNVEPYLDRCVGSLVRQTYDNLEILLVDDGSTDNSGVLAEDWGRKDSRTTAPRTELKGCATGWPWRTAESGFTIRKTAGFLMPEIMESTGQRGGI